MRPGGCEPPVAAGGPDFEHALSAFHPDMPHGAGLIMISEAYYSFFARTGSSDQRLVDMAKALGKTDAEKPADFVKALTELQAACGVAGLKMSDYGVTPDECESLAGNARETMGALFECDPAPLSDADVISIFRKSYR